MGDVQWQLDREVVLDRFVAACSGDDRIVAVRV